MQNCEHDLAEQCQVVLAFSNLTCQMLLLGAVSVETLESLSLYSHTNFLGSLYKYKISLHFLNINVKLHEENCASKVYVNGF